MKQSDIISAFINELLEERDGKIEIRRNELAQHFNVAPSQINYVISSRFSPEHGYVIESRRGGGGYIRICRVSYDSKNIQIMHIVNSVGKTLTRLEAALFLKNMEEYGYISEESHRLIMAATSDASLYPVPTDRRDEARASILKNMLTSLQQ